ncbi:triokinase/FMN cyclase-like isoform X2 [Ostrinia furnacalis]|nr:triokinase/FMN cyclase-like isoform X2 [Ostrinia furnacalis]
MAAKPVTSKIINSPETCVDDNLHGLVAMYPMLRLHPMHRVVTVRSQTVTGKVALIGGGGSGHEPFAAGFVGSGMLDGSIAGGIFASPPTGNVLYTIAYLAQYNKGGCLVLIGNYTGDRLNFGKAIEKAKLAGIKAEGVILGEDVASSHNKTGGRGMLSEVFLFKMCGAMAAQGADLTSMRDAAAEAVKYMGTLGVCISPCSLPGQPPLFEIAHGEMELGAGVHGEAGISKEQIGTAKEVVGLILEKIVDYLKLAPGNRVVAMINNLGGTSILEMNIISKEIKDYLDCKKIKLERIYSGHMKSSLEMHGFQICLLHLPEDKADVWLGYLDAPTNAPAWPGGEASVGNGGSGTDVVLTQKLLTDEKMKASGGPSLSAKGQDILRNCLTTAARELEKNEALLNRLDSGCGDGDCGNTLKKFAQAVLTYVEEAPMAEPASVLWDLSEAAERDMGGTSGGIYSLGLAAASQALSTAKSNDLASWVTAWESAMAAINKYGGAEPGDRTMLDTLHYAAQALKQNIKGDLKTALLSASVAADNGAKATAAMTAR